MLADHHPHAVKYGGRRHMFWLAPLVSLMRPPEFRLGDQFGDQLTMLSRHSHLLPMIRPSSRSSSVVAWMIQLGMHYASQDIWRLPS